MSAGLLMMMNILLILLVQFEMFQLTLALIGVRIGPSIGIGVTDDFSSVALNKWQIAAKLLLH